MFWTDEPYIPSCCDQMFFPKFFEELSKRRNLCIYPNADYTLAQFIARLVLWFPMAELTLVMTSTPSVETLHELHKWTSRIYDTTSKKAWLSSLHLVLPTTSTEDAWAKTSVSVRVSHADFLTPMLLFTPQAGDTIAILGAIPQTATTSKQTPGALFCTVEDSIVKELQTIVRINTRCKP